MQVSLEKHTTALLYAHSDDVCVCVQVTWTATWTPVRVTVEDLWFVRMNWGSRTCGESLAGENDVVSLDTPEFIHR